MRKIHDLPGLLVWAGLLVWVGLSVFVAFDVAWARNKEPASSGASRRSCVLAHQIASRISPEGVPQIMLNMIAKTDTLAPTPTYPLMTVCTLLDTTRVVPVPSNEMPNGKS